MHSDDDGVDIDKLGTEVDEVGKVAVDEIDELMVEGGEVVVKFRCDSLFFFFYYFLVPLSFDWRFDSWSVLFPRAFI